MSPLHEAGCAPRQCRFTLRHGSFAFPQRPGCRRERQGAAIDARALPGLGQLSKVAPNRILRCSEFARDLGGEDAPLGGKSLENQMVTFAG